MPDSTQGTLFDEQPDDAPVSVKREGKAYRVRVHGVEVIVRDDDLLVFGMRNDKLNVEVNGKVLVFENGDEVLAFGQGMRQAKRHRGGRVSSPSTKPAKE